jgi:hypothetical protein
MQHPEQPWSIVQLPVIPDHRGNLTFIEGNRHIPFPIERVYYLYDVPGGTTRAGHAHKQLKQLIIAASGSFDVKLDDGTRKETISLNRSNRGVLLQSMVWREIDNFSSGAVCLVLASMRYEESDYYRSYEDFQAALGKKG